MHKRARAETILLQSAESLRYVFESVPIGIIIDNQDGLVVSVNAAAERIFDYHRDEMLGQPTVLLFPERFRSKYSTLREETIASPVPHSMERSCELRGLSKQGAEIPIDLNLAPLRGLNGQFAVSEIVNITLRKKMDAKNSGLRRSRFKNQRAAIWRASCMTNWGNS